MEKKIFLIGLNLYSIFLSLKIKSDFKNLDVRIIEGSSKFLGSYKSLKLGRYKVNPGFHTFEDVRSNSLINFLKKTTKFYKIKKTRGMIINKSLISCQDNIKSWPKDIIQKFKISEKNICYKNKKTDLNRFEKKYINYLKDCFSDNRTSFNDAIDLSYPWFFPPNYKENSKDEGFIFTQKIRDKKIDHKYVFPKGALFENISKGLKELLKKNGIKVVLKKPVKFVKKNKKIIFDGYELLNNSKDLKIICIPVQPLNNSIISFKKNKMKQLIPIRFYTGLIKVKNFIKSDLDKFMEIIIASKSAIGLKRISLYSDLLKINTKIYQIEFLENLKETNIQNQIDNILIFLSKFIKFKKLKNSKGKIELIDYCFVRNIFRPKVKVLDLVRNNTIKFFDNQNNIIFPRQILWPINSNKHFNFANEDYKKLIKKHINN